MKVTRGTMADWVVQALRDLGGNAHFVRVAKAVWDSHESDLRGAGDFFYKWQYGMRWAGDQLQREGKLKKGAGGLRGNWALIPEKRS